MREHTLKLLAEYGKAKLDGLKPFEIRVDDRDFRVGDKVRYVILGDNELAKIFENRVYEIIYITNYGQKDGHVVFTDRLVTE